MGWDGWSVSGGPVAIDHLAMRSFIRPLVPIGLALMLLASVVPATLAADTDTSDAAISSAEKAALTLTNQRRAKAGLVPLIWDSRMAALARDRAAYMARSGNFSHTQSGGTDVFDLIADAGIRWYGAGEIIAWNTADGLEDSAAFATQGWMNSSGHRAIVLSKGYNYVGFGLAIAEDGRRYWAGVYLKGPDRTGAWSKFRTAASRSYSSAKTKVYFSWSGADTRLQVLTSGLRVYETQRRVDGGAWASYGTTTSTSVTRYWWKGHTWDFRVRARDKAGNWGAWKVVTVKL